MVDVSGTAIAGVAISSPSNIKAKELAERLAVHGALDHLSL
ncbi:hypothetical protein HCH_06366 [Hahella chejuensis KCTC 2396]|uniref:Uncharacterized protein n=1 Tax=Hahella chejuensis (strain KCTC 2396) TaxID=349521 RepID=Q2S8L3_HAHCH|nr:hypothetical protein HCH_06366 [Hahella chejuensis KCTC 2396]